MTANVRAQLNARVRAVPVKQGSRAPAMQVAKDILARSIMRRRSK